MTVLLKRRAVYYKKTSSPSHIHIPCDDCVESSVLESLADEFASYVSELVGGEQSVLPWYGEFVVTHDNTINYYVGVANANVSNSIIVAIRRGVCCKHSEDVLKGFYNRLKQ